MKTRKEMRAEYKQMKFRMGVFQIRNVSNGKIYLGSSQDLKATWNSQQFQLNAGLHQNEELQKDWKKYGCEGFAYEILDEIKQAEDQPAVFYLTDLKALEELMLEELQPFENNGYNRKKKSLL